MPYFKELLGAYSGLMVFGRDDLGHISYFDRKASRKYYISTERWNSYKGFEKYYPGVEVTYGNFKEWIIKNKIYNGKWI